MAPYSEFDMSTDKIKATLAAQIDGDEFSEELLENGFVRMGDIWPHIHEGIKEDTVISRYFGNAAFSLSSSIGWDIREGDTSFFYPANAETLHPFAAYVPVSYVVEKMENASNFTVGINDFLSQARGQRHRSSPDWWDTLKGKLSSLFGQEAKAEQPKPRDDRRSRLYHVMAKALLAAEADMIAKDVMNDIFVEGQGYKFYDAATSSQPPFFLSADEKGASFDFVLRRN